MSSRTKKILQLAAAQLNKGDGENLSSPQVENNDCKDCTNCTSNINKGDVIVDNIFNANTFIVDENGTLVQIFPETEVNLNDSNTNSDSFGSLPKNLHFSEAEALGAVEELEHNDYSIMTHTEHDYSLSENTFSQIENSDEFSSILCNKVPMDAPELSQKVNNEQEIIVVAEVYNEKIQLPEPRVLLDSKVAETNQQITTSVEVETDVNDLNIIAIETEENTSVNNTEYIDIEALNVYKDVSQDILKPKRRKRHQVTEDDWECKKAKILREQGKEYKGRRVLNGKVTGFVSRPKRTMKEVTCKCKSKTFYCKKLTESERQKMFNDFWKLSWKERKIVIKMLTDVLLTQRSRDRKIENASRRKFSFKFHLYVNNTTKIRVCKKTLLATLGIGEWMINKWLEDGEECVELTEENKTDERTENKRRSKNITRQEDLNTRLDLLKEFFLALPKVESHYCRESSQKLYLESCWLSKAQLFQVYTDNWCKEKECKPLSSCTFHKTFEDLNLCLYRPKKDQCDICRAHKLKHISDEEYDDHLKKKTAARQEKEKDKENEEHVYTVDLQSLLLSPKSNSSALYYRRKLSVHNLCIYDLKTHDGFCYLWNETEGELTANEFSSIVSHFIQSQLPLRNKAKKIVIFSDGCNYQNKNSVLSNALLYLSIKFKICIESKYLEKGHTQMECDSMHATIERYLRQRDIHVPADYVEVCKNARKHPRPYNVTYLEHSFFKNYTKPIMYKSIRPGLKKGDAKVTDIHCLQYSDDGKIYYKLNFEDEFKPLPACEDNTNNMEEDSRKSRRKRQDPQPLLRQPISKIQTFLESDFPNLYNSRLKITEAKYNHLQELKMTIPRDYHSFYDKLSF